MTLGKMIERLSKVDDISWGMYAFSRDVLCRKIDDARKQDMIRKAMECGSDTDMVTFMWCNECFDPQNPDTFFEKV